MIKSFLKKLTVTAAAAALLLGVVPAVASAQTTADVCQGVGIVNGSGGCSGAAQGRVETVVRTVINVLSIVVGVVSVIMIIIGGLKYVTSGGDSSSVQSAKNTILYAIVGLVVAALSQVIVSFVLTRVG